MLNSFKALLTLFQRFQRITLQQLRAFEAVARLAKVHGLVRGRLRIVSVTTAEYFVPDCLSPLAPGAVAIIPLQGFPLRRRWSVVWCRDQPLSAAARGFIAYLRGTPGRSPQGQKCDGSTS